MPYPHCTHFICPQRLSINYFRYVSMAVRFALIELKSMSLLMVVSQNQITNRHTNISYCNILGRTHQVIILGFNKDYHLLNDIATVRNCKQLKVILTRCITEVAPIVDLGNNLDVEMVSQLSETAIVANVMNKDVERIPPLTEAAPVAAVRKINVEKIQLLSEAAPEADVRNINVEMIQPLSEAAPVAGLRNMEIEMIPPLPEAAPDVRSKDVEIIPPPLVPIDVCFPLPSTSFEQEASLSTPKFKTR